MIELHLSEEHVFEVFEILCGIPYESTTYGFIPSHSRNEGIEQLIAQLARYIGEDV